MKNYFIKISIFFLSICFVACTNDDNSAQPDEAFFNLNVGNQWVYKKYDFDFDTPGVYTFSGIIDNVEVVDIVNLNGISFSKIKHTKTSENNPSQYIYYEYLRVNDKGHLIGISENDISNIENINENSGNVYHPGIDFDYQKNFNQSYGSMTYSVSPATTITVENNSYNTVLYKGVFTPISEGLPSKTTEDHYQKQIGLVKRICHTVSTNYSWEERLVSYTIVN